MSNASPAASSSVVPRTRYPPRVLHVEQHRVPAAREQAGERRREVERLEIERRDMAVQMVDRDQRQPPRPRERLRRRDADEQRADQPGPAVTATLEIAEPAPASPSASRTTGIDELEMPARRHLGHDAAEARVQLGL